LLSNSNMEGKTSGPLNVYRYVCICVGAPTDIYIYISPVEMCMLFILIFKEICLMGKEKEKTKRKDY